MAITTAGVVCAGSVFGHEVGLSRGEYAIEGSTVSSRVIFARKELVGLVAGLDADHDGALTDAELAAGRDSVQGAIVSRMKVTGDGAPCPGTLEGASLVDQDGVAVSAVYRCARRPKRVTISPGFFGDVAFGHRHLGRATAGTVIVDQVLSQRTPELSIDVPEDLASTDARREIPAAGGSPFLHGAARALGSWRGAAFTAALLATISTTRGAITAVLAATAAALAGALVASRGVFVPSPRALAIGVAVALVYAGLDAALSRVPSARVKADWRLVVPLAVALGAADELALGTDGGATAVLGLASGQLALGAVVALLLFAAQRRTRLGRYWPALGGVVAAAGAIDVVLLLRA